MESAGAAAPGAAHVVPILSSPEAELELEERDHGSGDGDGEVSLSRSRSLDGEELRVVVEDIPPEIGVLQLPAESSKTPPGPEQEGKENPGKKKKKKEKAQAVPFYKLFAFADGVDYVLMLLGTVGAVGVGASQPALALLLGSILNVFGSNGTSVNHAMNQLVLKLIYIGIASALAGYFAVAFWAATGERQSNRIRTAYLRAILKQDVAFFDKETATGEVVARLAADTLLIQAAVGDQAGRFAQYMSTFVAGYAIALYKGWKLALVIASSLPLLFGTGALGAAIVQLKNRRGMDAYSEGAKVVEQILSSIRTVVCFSGEKKAVDDYDRSLKKGYKVSVTQTAFASVGVAGIFLVLYNTYALGLWYGSVLVTEEGYNGGAALTIIFSIILGGLSLGHAAPTLGAIQLGQQASFKLFEVIARKPPIDSSDPGGESIADLKGNIELHQVHFYYPTRPGVQIFSNFSLSIPSCSTVALVGESGSGKSTVVSLIERFYDPQSGEVLIDGVDIKTLNVTWLRQQIGLVGQEPVLFAASIKENIAYGKPGATMEEIQAAAERANAAVFIGKFPEGYDTQVGEHGAQLSGGQKQRVAIARAILKNPKILLLDEATSALDTKSETVVQDALDRLMNDRTTVVVAHRLSTIRNADLIAVVQHGAIIQQGTHAELLSNESGAYFQLVQLQALKPAEEPEADVDDDEVNLISYASSRSSSRYSSSRRSSSFRSHAGKPGDSSELRARIKQASKQGLVDRLIRRPKPVYDLETGRLFPHKDHSIFRLVSLLRGDGRLFAGVGILGAIGYGASTPVFGLLLAHSVTVFYNPDPHEVRKQIKFWACMFIVLAVGVAIVMPIRTLCLQVMGHKLARVVRRSMFSKVVRQEISWFDAAENSSGAVSARLAVDASLVQTIVGDLLSLLVQNLATVVGALLIGFLANWKLAFVVFAMMPLIGLQGYVQIQRARGSGARTKVEYAEASQLACDAVGSIRTVASFCAEQAVVQAFEAKCKIPKEHGIKQGFMVGAGLGFAQFATFVAYALSFWYGARLVDKGETSFHQIFRVFLAIALSATSIAQSTSLAPDLGRVSSAVDSIFEILDAKSKIDSSNMDGKILPSVKGDIEFRHVKFRYPSRPDILIFRNFSLSIPSGQTVALVGESGSGKSTAISLLERFYDPDAGLILLDNIDIKELQLKWLRQQLGLVSQEPVLFNDTIRANILYGRHDNGTGPDVSQEEVEAAAKASNAHKFISDLPDGYNTMVGEKGTQLSGGQKQRIAIARAIIKNPKVLLLDEATSALDAESERVVQDALDRVAMDRTTIMIAHRLSSVQNADLIAVVKHRTIVEKGRHQELMSKPKGAYAQLANLRSSTQT